MRTLLLLLALSLPTLAQSLGLLGYPATHVQGVVQQITPGGVVVSANGASLVLPGGLSFQAGGVNVNLGGLAVGQPITAMIPAGTGEVVGYANGLVYVQTPQGVVPVPSASLTGNAAATKVNVLKPNGKVVTVPLHAAYTMQQSQGAIILGARTSPYTPQAPLPGLIINTTGNWATVQGLQNGLPVLYQVPANQVSSWVQPWDLNGPGAGNGEGKGQRGKGKGKGNQGWDDPGQGGKKNKFK